MGGIQSVTGSIRGSGGIKKSSGIASLLNTAGTGLRASVLPGGRVTLNAEPKARRAKTARHPLRVYAAQRTPEGLPTVSVQFGMVNALVPTFAGQPLNYTTGSPPRPLALAITQSGFLALTVNTDSAGKAVTAAIAFATTVPVTSETQGVIVLASITHTAASGSDPASISIAQTVSGSLWHQRCGPNTHLFGLV